MRLRCQSYPAYPVDWATLRLDEFKSGVKYAEHGGGKQVRSKVTLKYHMLNDLSCPRYPQGIAVLECISS